MRRYGRPLERSFIPPTMIRIFVLLFDLFQKERNTSHHLHSSFRPTLQRNKKRTRVKHQQQPPLISEVADSFFFLIKKKIIGDFSWWL